MLALLPFQVNATRFVIPYYVVTRDIRRDLPEEAFRVTIKGLAGKKAKVTAYDPSAGPIQANPRAFRPTGDDAGLELPATDYPMLLEVEEARPVMVADPERSGTEREIPCSYRLISIIRYSYLRP